MRLVELVVLAAATWVGAQIAQIEYADFSRCFTVAVFALVFSIIIKVVLGATAAVTTPMLYAVGWAFGAAAGSLIAIKTVLMLDWQPAIVIASTVAVIEGLFIFFIWATKLSQHLDTENYAIG